MDPLQSEQIKLLESWIAEGKNFYIKGKYIEAEAMFDKFLKFDPTNDTINYFSGLSCYQRKDFPKCEHHLRLVLEKHPNHTNVLFYLANALVGSQKLDEGCKHYQKLLLLQPDHAAGHLYLGKILLLMGIGKLPLAHYHQRMAEYLSKEKVESIAPPVEHTIFLNPEKALQTALQGNYVKLPDYTDRQVCCYFRTPFRDAPSNLFSLALADQPFIIDYFLHTKHNLPTAIDFDPDNKEECIMAEKIATYFDHAISYRNSEVKRLKNLCRTVPSVFVQDQPLRIFLYATYRSPVTVAVYGGLAQAFRKNGCDVLYIYTSDENNLHSEYYLLKERLCYNPHIVVNIDILIDSIHPDTFCVLWSHNDAPLRRLYGNKHIEQRNRDIIYAIAPELKALLYKLGAKEVELQRSCYDENIFRDYNYNKRARKVVFCGGNRGPFLRNFTEMPNYGPLMDVMTKMFNNGEPFTQPTIQKLSKEYGCPEEVITWRLREYVVRNTSVYWLCSFADEINVEIYGPYWDGDKIVQPYYKGQLSHGQPLADVYNQALYALAAHPFDLESQRIVEVSACGCIPIVYDCRHLYDKKIPGSEGFLWYRTKEELRACLTQIPSNPPSRACHGKRYTDVAKRILTKIANVHVSEK